MGRELETKFAAAPETLARLAHDAGELTELSMHTRYYDTPSGALHKRKWTLRVREENGVPICTLKTPRADGSRGEWETPCADLVAAAPVLAALGAPKELETLTREGLRETCGARFTRRCKRVEFDGAVLELALDEGVLTGGTRSEPLCEIELELKSGPDTALFEASTQLAERYSLVPERKSKFQRALALAEK